MPGLRGQEAVVAAYVVEDMGHERSGIEAVRAFIRHVSTETDQVGIGDVGAQLFVGSVRLYLDRWDAHLELTLVFSRSLCGRIFVRSA